MKRSAEKPWVLAFMWMPLDIATHPKTVADQVHPLMAHGTPDCTDGATIGTAFPDTPQKLFKSCPREYYKERKASAWQNIAL